ncbi:hypothetical protein BC939DRAFT_478992 [Gamsiella multidivaricata]|uniref:uncharacterized protein n=1 Tax=Gamsiella multidivaricata TaxID=101098 RepID=UPI0022204413|nr:uncharacterized protein BC939DRAFT_478992 [Gamsiella multidivaricata]KAG0354019.1 hypothetical protein BGZ54_001895 [Gamsiella multidivaricata]KAI7820258.1 hypothetical protein BC939DRAFT_478992 [Gamsiella multidivaricata]
MATYKQRTPYQRIAATYSDDAPPATGATKQAAAAAAAAVAATSHATTVHLTSLHHHHHQHHNNNHHPYSSSSSLHYPEDEFVENTSDHEWTSIRNSNSTASARARARQQQYLDQQQQRTREWQFVLAQHHRQSLSPPGLAIIPKTTATTTAAATSREVSSDEYEDILSGTETPSVVASPGPNLISTGASIFGFSDLTSDGLGSVGECEDPGVWSHEDEDDNLSLSIPVLRRLPSPSSPFIASSTAISLSNIPTPSFAASPHHMAVEHTFQNQMPFHDGSGNFTTARSVRSQLDSDVDSERGWESSSSRASSLLRQYRSRPTVHRRISSSEFQAVIQNIADLQHTGARPSMTRQSSRPRGVDDQAVSSSRSQPLFTYPSAVTKRPIFNIYESEMEDMADMVLEVPAKIGWLNAFELALQAMQSNGHGASMSEATMLSPIKVFAEIKESTTESSIASESSVPTDNNSGSSEGSLQQQVKQNMSAASFETLKRLQTRKRSNPHRPYSSDPMQVDFSPTLKDRPMPEDICHKDQRIKSRSTGTSTSNSSSNSSLGMRTTNLLAVVLSTLRRFQNHVQSNLLYADFYDEEDRQADLARSLGFDGDLGIQWSSRAADVMSGGETDPSDRAAATGSGSGSGTSRDRRDYRRHERTPSIASSVSRSSSRSNIRRANSDCGLESMKHYRNRDSHHSIHSGHHRPSLVE